MTVTKVRSEWSSGNLIFKERTAGDGSEIDFGVDGDGLDTKWFGDTAGVYMLWDESADGLLFVDNAKTVFGTGSDGTVRWDGTDLDILAGADDLVIKFGNGTNSFDLWLYGNTASDYLLWDASANSLTAVGGATIRPLTAIADPGAGGAIPVTVSGYVPIVTAGVETRTIAAPTYIGQELLVYMKTDGGNCTITVATTVNETGNNTITFANTGEAVRMIAVEEGANLRWRCTVADPSTILSTV